MLPAYGAKRGVMSVSAARRSLQTSDCIPRGVKSLVAGSLFFFARQSCANCKPAALLNLWRACESVFAKPLYMTGLLDHSVAHGELFAPLRHRMSGSLTPPALIIETEWTQNKGFIFWHILDTQMQTAAPPAGVMLKLGVKEICPENSRIAKNYRRGQGLQRFLGR